MEEMKNLLRSSLELLVGLVVLVAALLWAIVWGLLCGFFMTLAFPVFSLEWVVSRMLGRTTEHPYTGALQVKDPSDIVNLLFLICCAIWAIVAVYGVVTDLPVTIVAMLTAWAGMRFMMFSL